MPFLRAKTVEIAREVISFDFLPEKSTLTYKHYGRVENDTLRHPLILNFVEELNEGFPSNNILRVTTLDDVVLMECDEETALFLVCVANSFIYHKVLCCTRRLFYYNAFSLLKQVRMG